MFKVIFILSDGTQARDLDEGNVLPWVKMPRFNTFSRFVNAINLKNFPSHGGINRFERILNQHSEER